MALLQTKMKKEAVLYFIEKLLLPILFLTQAIQGFLNLDLTSPNIIYSINEVIRPLSLAILLFLTSQKRRNLNTKILSGLILSYGSLFLFQTVSKTQNTILSTIAFSSFLFYLSFGLYSIYTLGKSFSILPSSSKLVSSGPYILVRHPIYSSYIHFLLIFVITNFSAINILSLLLFIFGLILRSQEEEKILTESDSNYSTIFLDKPRFFQLSITLPVLITSIIALYLSQFKNREIISVNIGAPIYSLNPVIADDWSSFFVINHIYPRFLSQAGSFRANSILESKEIECAEKSISILSAECKRVIVNYKLRSSVESCNGKKYLEDDFKQELSAITSAKDWILPGFEWCDGGKKCFSFRNINNIQNHLTSIYLRFGWSTFSALDKITGIKPNCFSVGSKDGNLITSGTIKSEKLEIYLSTSNQSPDVFLYENSSEDLNYINTDFFNPIFYFLVLNGASIKDSNPWISQNTKNLIQKEFMKMGIIGNKLSNDYLDYDFKKIQVDYKKSKITKNEKIIILPDYLHACINIQNYLNRSTLAQEESIHFKCEDITAFVEETVKKPMKWDGFISPLTPGYSSRDALYLQYFDYNSSDNWLGRTDPGNTKVDLIGFSNGKMKLKGKKFCSVKPNPLGLSDLTVDDFNRCL